MRSAKFCSTRDGISYPSKSNFNSLLDTKAADVAIEMMRTVNRENGTTFLIVTHSMDIAHRCDRIIDVVDGQIV